MRTAWPMASLAGLALAATISFTAPVHAQVTMAQSEVPYSTLVGRWVRPDGGYVVAINSVSPEGKLDASYANPSPLPFSRAEASREGSKIKVFLELTAGGYGGSTYTLGYDAEQDILRGVYYQAIAGQDYNIFFERQK